MFYVYVLRSLKDNKRYVGLTSDISRRFREHQNGLVKSTRHRRPFELIYYESYENKSEAMKREKFFKTGKGREFLNSLSR
ncbi:GIY-YIG nuclease family protein [Melioribacter roseus]|uniref:GIY-YIG nuclease family protein n=1 Tax=Melioribacter roseus TaxID=1134405 RepID=UPI0009DA5BFB|nr:GIY-YIG nuclease family protein [Melioribacter roseus]